MTQHQLRERADEIIRDMLSASATFDSDDYMDASNAIVALAEEYAEERAQEVREEIAKVLCLIRLLEPAEGGE